MKGKKIIVALVLLPAFIWLIGWAPVWPLLVVLIVLGAGLGGWESARLVFGDGDLTFRVLATALSVGCAFASATGSDQWTAIGFLSAALVSFFIAGLISTDVSEVAGRIGKLLFVAVYPGLLIGYIAALRGYDGVLDGTKLVVILFLLTWINDAGAFFVGSAFGKHKLAPRISPNKTWEGSAGGFAASVLAGAGVGMWTSFFSVPQGLMLGALLGVAGPVGDLVESAIKRGADVKDSGRLLPGHGGVLDRIDSVIVCAPLLYYYVVISHHAQLVRLFGLTQ